MARQPDNWIKGAIKHPGKLRAALKTPKGQNIPEAKLMKAEKSKNPTLRKEATLAQTLKGMPKKKKGGKMCAKDMM